MQRGIGSLGGPWKLYDAPDDVTSWHGDVAGPYSPHTESERVVAYRACLGAVARRQDQSIASRSVQRGIERDLVAQRFCCAAGSAR